MAKLTPYEIKDLVLELIEELPVSLQSKITVSIVDREVELLTEFGFPYLDLALVINNFGFVINYSNETREENVYKKGTDTVQIVKDAINTVKLLIEGGAILYINKNSKGEIISMRTDIAGGHGETNAFKFSLLSRAKEFIKKYPPVAK